MYQWKRNMKKQFGGMFYIYIYIYIYKDMNYVFVCYALSSQTNNRHFCFDCEGRKRIHCMSEKRKANIIRKKGKREKECNIAIHQKLIVCFSQRREEFLNKTSDVIFQTSNKLFWKSTDDSILMSFQYLFIHKWKLLIES